MNSSYYNCVNIIIVVTITAAIIHNLWEKVKLQLLFFHGDILGKMCPDEKSDPFLNPYANYSKLMLATAYSRETYSVKVINTLTSLIDT